MQFPEFRGTSLGWNALAKAGILLCWLGWAVCHALAAAIDLPTYHLDGAFQTASSLYRLDAGQAPGKDFYPYLGVGPFLFLYPLFKAFGAHLAASVFSAKLLTLLLGSLATALIWQMIWRPRSFFTSLAAAPLLLLVPVMLIQQSSLPLPQWLEFAVTPGNSLRPIRAAAPYLLVSVYYLFLAGLGSAKLRYGLAGLLTGAVLLWSNDFAIPSAGLFALLLGLDARRSGELSRHHLLLYLCATALSWLVLLWWLTEHQPLALLAYQFTDVARDQWWFFGPYDESSRIFHPLQLSRLIDRETLAPLLVLALVAALACRTRTFEHRLLCWLGTVLFAGGVIASVGGHLGGYFGGFYFWAMMTLGIALLRLAWIALARAHRAFLPGPGRAALGRAALGLLWLLSVLPAGNAWSTLHSAAGQARSDPERFYVVELGGYLGSEWRDYIALARQSDGQQVLEEYWGLWSATRRVFPVWPVDSTIHALGQTRGAASRSLPGADIVISTRNAASPRWQPWNLSQNYWFYEELLHSWTPRFLSPTTVVWQRSGHARSARRIDCRIAHQDSPLLILDIPRPGFYEIAMRYASASDGRTLILIRNNLSFGANAGGYVSIDPDGQAAKFPAYIPRAGATSLDVKVAGAPGRELRITACSAREIALADREVLPVPQGGETGAPGR